MLIYDISSVLGVAPTRKREMTQGGRESVQDREQMWEDMSSTNAPRTKSRLLRILTVVTSGGGGGREGTFHLGIIKKGYIFFIYPMIFSRRGENENRAYAKER